MLSKRGIKSATSQDIPWRFAPGGNDRYDALSNPTGVISFATAENNLMHEELREFVDKNVSIPTLAYTYRFSTMGGPRFPIAMAEHINDYFQTFTPIKAENIITASGLTSIHELLGYSLGDPGDGILVSRPFYGRFELDFGNTSALNLVYAEMAGTDPFSPTAVPKYQAALESAAQNGISVKAVLIVNPHNPLGRTYSAATLRALMNFCQENNLHLISDEVYALSAYDARGGDGIGFKSILSIDPREIIDEDRVHVLYGMSKDFAAAGLRLGCLITRNSQLRKAVACNMRFHNPSGMSIAIGTAMLEDRVFVSLFLKLSHERLRASREYTTRVLDGAGVKYQNATAGFFLFIDLSPWVDLLRIDNDSGNNAREFALAQKLLDAGVGLHPGEEHAEDEGQFRLVFSQERMVLEEGLRRFVGVLDEIKCGQQTTSIKKRNGASSAVQLDRANCNHTKDTKTAH